MKTCDTKIYCDMLNLSKQLEIYIKNFKHEYKYTYGTLLRQTGNAIIRDVCMANTSNKMEHRAFHISNALAEFESYKYLLRMVYFNKCINSRQAAIIEEMLGNIGNQLGGWKRYSERKCPEPPELTLEKEFEKELKNSKLDDDFD